MYMRDIPSRLPRSPRWALACKSLGGPVFVPLRVGRTSPPETQDRIERPPSDRSPQSIDRRHRLQRSVRLPMDSSLASAFTSRSQAARAVTEARVAGKLYCPSCISDMLEPTSTGTKVVDFRCPVCAEPFQLKSQSHQFRSRVLNSAYEPMMKSIVTFTAPSFLFLHYRPLQWVVQDLFFVPRYFLSPSFVERRPPLGPTARRAG